MIAFIATSVITPSATPPTAISESNFRSTSCRQAMNQIAPRIG